MKNCLRVYASIANSNTGSYYTTTPNHSREIINGAMKVLRPRLVRVWNSLPRKWPDYCINNKPVMEGCDIVDYIYVLYRCSAQTDYKRRNIENFWWFYWWYKKIISRRLREDFHTLEISHRRTITGFLFLVERTSLISWNFTLHLGFNDDTRCNNN